MIVGGVLSWVRTAKEQVDELPLPSVAASVTMVELGEVNTMPANGDCVIVGLVVQLSMATTVLTKLGRLASQLPSSASDWVIGHTIVGGVFSRAATVKLHMLVFPFPSFAIRLIK